MAENKSLLEIVLMPLVIAVVGSVGTFVITTVQNGNTLELTKTQLTSTEKLSQAQLNRAKEEADASRQLKLLEIFGEKITSNNTEDKQIAVRVLGLVDPDLAKGLTEIVLNTQSAPQEVRELARSELLRRIQLNVSAVPDIISAGQKTIITAIARDGSGKPLQDAVIRVMGGGGKFLLSSDEPYDPKSTLQGPTGTSGTTDAGGRFTASWVCNPCASGYVLDVNASKAQYLEGKSQVTINIR